MKLRLLTALALLGCASLALAVDAMVGKRYQITTLMGTTA